MKKELIDISPEMAQELLQSQKTENRPLNELLVDRIVQDIDAGTFDRDQTFVVLYEDGDLFYGQHLLNAIIKCGRNVEMNVCQLEENDQKTKGSMNYNSPYTALYYTLGKQRETHKNRPVIGRNRIKRQEK